MVVLVKLMTSAEYLPPLPEALPDESFQEIGKLMQLTEERRQLLSLSAYLLVDGIYRNESRPRKPQIGIRLERVIRVLEKRQLADLSALLQVESQLASDGIGDVLGSLLTPQCPSEPHVSSLSSAAALKKWRAMLLVSATNVKARLEAQYGGRRGAEPEDYIDLFIDRLAKIYTEAGGHASAAYSEARQNRQSPFVKLVVAVAKVALQYIAPGKAEVRRVLVHFTPCALEERVLMVLNPTARKRRTDRARKYQAKK
jgi:hypothetical protein